LEDTKKSLDHINNVRIPASKKRIEPLQTKLKEVQEVADKELQILSDLQLDATRKTKHIAFLKKQIAEKEAKRAASGGFVRKRKGSSKAKKAKSAKEGEWRLGSC